MGRPRSGDNGGGIETETIESILDYTIRVSSREAYVSPTRGAQGNALKTILAMGYVLDREREDVNSINNDAVEVTFIESRGVKHRIEFRADHVTNQPKITHKSKRTTFAVHRPGEPAPGYARRRLSPATRPQRLLV